MIREGYKRLPLIGPDRSEPRPFQPAAKRQNALTQTRTHARTHAKNIHMHQSHTFTPFVPQNVHGTGRPDKGAFEQEGSNCTFRPENKKRVADSSGASENDSSAFLHRAAEKKGGRGRRTAKGFRVGTRGSPGSSSSSLWVNMAVFAQTSDERKARKVRLQKDSLSITPGRVESPVHG